MGVKLLDMKTADGKTMGFKPSEYWDDVAKRIVRLIGRVDRARNMALQMEEPSAEKMAQEMADDIDALIDALVVIEFEYEQHFGRRPQCLRQWDGRRAPAQ